uniref:Uncharacterized protein n=1 Tax=Arundo donax TaxID=35708 RepID=A0A0A8ZVI7_ARUDO
MRERSTARYSFIWRRRLRSTAMCVSRWLSVSSLDLQLRASRRRFLTLGGADDVASIPPGGAATAAAAAAAAATPDTSAACCCTGAGPPTMPASQNAEALSKRKLAALKVS